MEMIFDIIVEALFEFFGEGFISLGEALVPEKALSERARKIIGWILVFLSPALFIGLVVGVVLLVETAGQSPWDWVLASLSAVYFALGLLSHFRKKRYKDRMSPD